MQISHPPTDGGGRQERGGGAREGKRWGRGKGGDGVRVSDFLPARRPLRGRGRGVSLPGRCSGPFRPISTPGGRCCSLTGLGPHTTVSLPCPGAVLPDLPQPAPGVLSLFPAPPSQGTHRPSTPLAPSRAELPDPPPCLAPPSGPRDGRPPPPLQPATPRRTHPPLAPPPHPLCTPPPLAGPGPRPTPPSRSRSAPEGPLPAARSAAVSLCPPAPR